MTELKNPLEGEPTVQLQVGVTRYGIYPEIMLRNRDGKPFGVLELVEHLRKMFRLTERRALEFVEKIRVEAPELLDD